MRVQNIKSFEKCKYEIVNVGRAYGIQNTEELRNLALRQDSFFSP